MNLLALAHQLIPKQTIVYTQWKGKNRNSIGLDVDEYNAPENRRVKISPIKKDIYREHGLTYKRNYVLLHSIKNVLGLSRISNGDRFSFNSRIYQIESKSRWQIIANWDSYICIEIPNDGSIPDTIC